MTTSDVLFRFIVVHCEWFDNMSDVSGRLALAEVSLKRELLTDVVFLMLALLKCMPSIKYRSK